MSKQRILGDLAHNLDSSAVGSFLAKSSAGGDFQTVDYSSITGTPSVVLDSSLTSQLIDSSYIQLRETPSSSGIDSAAALNLIDSSYLSNINGTNTGFAEFYYDATAGQTIFDSDLRGRNLSYTEGGVMVFLNGVMLAPAQYTATDGSTVVLDSGASLSDEITVVKFGLGSSGGGGGSSGITYVGDRGLVFGGWPANSGSVYHSNVIMYFDITTPGNAQDFGDLSITCKWCSAGSNGTRAVNAHGENSSYTALDSIDYVTTATTGNATDFGNLTVARHYLGDCAAYNSTRVLWAGGYDTPNYNLRNEIDYVTTATAGNATDFGNLLAGTAGVTGTSSETYGIFSGGFTGSNLDVIQYVTIGTPGNSADFGDLTTARYMSAGTSDGTYGLIAAGHPSYMLSIDYITIATPGNATDFGDLTDGKRYLAGAFNQTRSVFCGGEISANTSDNVMEYVTTATPGNATDFGDLVTTNQVHSATSGSAS